MNQISTLPAALMPVDPTRPVAGYLGGKRLLAKRLCAMIGAIPHSLYVEPFVGMGGVFFRRNLRPETEVINDVSADVANLFRVLQRHYQPFVDHMRWKVASRAEFERLVRTDPSTLTDIEKAGRFLYLQRLAFGGQIVGRRYGVVTTGGARFNMAKLEVMLQDAHERLSGVVIECLPYADLIRRYDRPYALFYLDPPYFGCEDDYGPIFSRDDFVLLRGLLESLQGRFILSLNDRPEVREIFDGFTFETADLHYRVSGKVTAAKEVIITGP